MSAAVPVRLRDLNVFFLELFLLPEPFLAQLLPLPAFRFLTLAVWQERRVDVGILARLGLLRRHLDFAVLATPLTIFTVTLYLHRSQAHRAVDFHPVLSHFFRFWCWLTTSMITKEWAAIHRKHHAKCETEEDPHSPMHKGIKTVFWRGVELYREARWQREDIEKYGKGCPDDWIERHLYTPRSSWGPTLMLLINFALFGFAGVALWGPPVAIIGIWPREAVAYICLGVVGLVIVALFRGGDAPVLAVCLALAAALSWAVGNVISRRAGVVTGIGRGGTLSLTVWSSLVVPIPALALSFVIDGPAAVGAGLAAIGPQAVVSTLYTAGLCTLFAYAVFNGLLGRNRSAAVVPWILLAPVVAMASAALLRGEAPSVGEVVGGAVLVAGVLVSGIRRRQPVPRTVGLMGVPTRLSA